MDLQKSGLSSILGLVQNVVAYWPYDSLIRFNLTNSIVDGKRKLNWPYDSLIRFNITNSIVDGKRKLNWLYDSLIRFNLTNSIVDGKRKLNSEFIRALQ